ncbi:biopolymer transporter ExbD [uncultured Fusobacterium sp.]|uniref:ExbD/TolR family protein n=1 Tax=uncultured Fusobacterium sp. TaxID=159267 RepID=UPI0025F222EE|nr:biopolymer transporter ExbD [uncultured Fusobacterium sp.]
MKLERRKRKDELMLELTSLIDVVFLLLIFFLVATTFDDMKGGIKIDLPQSTIKEVSEVKEVQIVVDKDKNMILNYKENGKKEQTSVTTENLKEKLAEKLSESQERNVIISADKRLDYGYIVEIMTISKEAGANSLDIDTADKK